jgi:tRNA(Ile2) C34 agmatinyltransferase TiaS
MKSTPYTQEELTRILVFTMPRSPVRGRCDWCGGELEGTGTGIHICRRCWANRRQIADALSELHSNAHSEVKPTHPLENARHALEHDAAHSEKGPSRKDSKERGQA